VDRGVMATIHSAPWCPSFLTGKDAGAGVDERREYGMLNKEHHPSEFQLPRGRLELQARRIRAFGQKTSGCFLAPATMEPRDHSS